MFNWRVLPHLARSLARCKPTNAAPLADKVAPESPIGLLLRRLTLAGQTMSFEALCALHTNTTEDQLPIDPIELAMCRQPQSCNTATCAKPARRSCG